MSDILREQAQFRRAKTPIIAKYADDHEQLMSAIAGRGFDKMPGYAFDLENKIEFAAKMSISELNYKILADSIERELKQTGIDYDLSYKYALIAWELEKQVFMNAWAAELSGIKHGEAVYEEDLNLLGIEVQKRVIVFTEAKVAIELSMEAYKKTLAGLDGDVAPYETQLANAKLLTAQKKLDLIPILETILSKEQELLSIEQSKAGAFTNYMTAESALSTKKGTLTPFINQLATKSETLATKIATDQIPTEQAIADEKALQAAAIVAKSWHQIDELEADIETETKRIELMEAKRNLEETKFGYEQDLVSHEIQLTSDHQQAVLADSEQAIASERSAHTNIIDGKKTVETIKNTTKLTSVNTMTQAEKDASRDITNHQISEVEGVANANAAAKLTAALTHLIS
ncbi:MAG: hypothetical protein WC554_08310 [Clostridia bacterium]